jgi:hypothetical protein
MVEYDTMNEFRRVPIILIEQAVAVRDCGSTSNAHLMSTLALT